MQLEAQVRMKTGYISLIAVFIILAACAIENESAIEESAEFTEAYGHYRLAMRNINKQVSGASELTTSFDFCEDLPEWTEESYGAIEFVEEYRPHIKDDGYQERLDTIESLAQLHLAMFGSLELLCRGGKKGWHQNLHIERSSQ